LYRRRRECCTCGSHHVAERLQFLHTHALACARTQGLEEERAWKTWVRGPSPALCVQRDTFGSPHRTRTLWTFMLRVRPLVAMPSSFPYVKDNLCIHSCTSGRVLEMTGRDTPWLAAVPREEWNEEDMEQFNELVEDGQWCALVYCSYECI